MAQTTVIVSKRDEGCTCGDKATLKLNPDKVGLAANSVGQIFGSVLDVEKRKIGTKCITAKAYDPIKGCPVTTKKYVDVYEWAYTFSYEDTETNPPATLITCEDVDQLCCLGCGIDYVLNQIQTGGGSDVFLDLANSTFNESTSVLTLQLTNGSLKNFDLSSLLDNTDTFLDLTNSTFNDTTSVLTLQLTNNDSVDIDLSALQDDTLYTLSNPSGTTDLRLDGSDGSVVTVDLCPIVQQCDLGIADPACATIAQTAHGFTLPTYGVLALYYNETNSQYEPARADSLDTVADILAVELPDVNSFRIQEGNYVEVPGHGLTVGEWYVLDSVNPGQAVPASSVDPESSIFQNLFFVESDSCLILRIQEAVAPCTVCECKLISQTGHGFSEGDIVSYNTTSSQWEAAAAGTMAYFVTQVVDVDTFTIDRDFCASSVTGILPGVVYALDPSTPGSLIDYSTLDETTDPITVIGAGSANECLIGRTEAPRGVISTPPPAGITIYEDTFENNGASGCGFDAGTGVLQDLLQIGAGPFFHSQGIDSSCSMQSILESGSSGGERHRFMSQQFSQDYDCLTLQIDHLLQFEAAASLTGDRFAMLVASDGSGGFDGARLELMVLGGLNVRVETNDTDGTPFAAYTTSGGPIITNDTWFRYTLHVNLGTPGVADGAIRLIVDELGGDRASGGNSVVVGNVADESFTNIQLRNAAKGIDAVRLGGGHTYTNPTTVDTYQLWDNLLVTDLCNV